MTTALIYLVVMLLVAAVVFLLASLVFGRGEELAPLAPGSSPTRLPADGVTGSDIGGVRFQTVARGYKMGEVDWVMRRLGDEIDTLRGRVAELEADRDEQAAAIEADPVVRLMARPGHSLGGSGARGTHAAAGPADTATGEHAAGRQDAPTPVPRAANGKPKHAAPESGTTSAGTTEATEATESTGSTGSTGAATAPAGTESPGAERTEATGPDTAGPDTSPAEGGAESAANAHEAVTDETAVSGRGAEGDRR